MNIRILHKGQVLLEGDIYPHPLYSRGSFGRELRKLEASRSMAMAGAMNDRQGRELATVLGDLAGMGGTQESGWPLVETVMITAGDYQIEATFSEVRRE